MVIGQEGKQASWELAKKGLLVLLLRIGLANEFLVANLGVGFTSEEFTEFIFKKVLILNSKSQ